MEALTNHGLGLDYHDLRLERTTEAWVRAGSALRDEVAAILEDEVDEVEHVGSSSVIGLLGKPIVDMARS